MEKHQAALLKKSGYSDKAIHYYLEKINVGTIPNPSAHQSYTGACGDTMEFFLKIESGVIREAKFQAIGCAGSFSAGSALAEMIKGLTPEEALKISEADIYRHLEEVPEPKIHCITLTRNTLVRTIEEYNATTDQA
ncbi:MAG: iron-sulfur cluster assembly scaffold protein [Bacteroidales bacterium]|nr:MAG: iron-sulfur cluster assembly scaffold protein [Bacteroidales bacterium]